MDKWRVVIRWSFDLSYMVDAEDRDDAEEQALTQAENEDLAARVGDADPEIKSAYKLGASESKQ